MREVINMLTLSEFEANFNRLYPSLCLFANKYVNDLSLSEDIVQNVFIKVWEDKTSFHDKSKIDGFFYKAVRNKSLDFLKSKYAKDFKTYSDVDLEILQSENFFFSEAVIIDTSAIIQNAINLLPDKAAQVIRLSIKDFTNKEIANQMQISIHTVKDHKKMVYRKFRKLFAHLAIE
ncbi:MAG: sigma-70 family RNA polymerase sigma factor [Algibacter sp.]